jgi:fluoroquinolone transport system permease protein
VQKPKSTLQSLIKWDFKLQTSYGIIPIYILVAVLYVLILWLLPFPSSQLTELLIFLIFTDPVLLGFLFCAVLVYFERSENVLQALVTTPMQAKHYLISKVFTLSFMALYVSILVAIFPYAIENDFEWIRLIYLIIGVFLTAAVGVLMGYIIGAKYKTFNEYLIMMMPYMLFLMIPLLSVMGATPDYWFYYLIPSHGTLFLLKATWYEVKTWQIVYGIISLIVWIGILFKIALNSYEKYFVIEQGGKSNE